MVTTNLALRRVDRGIRLGTADRSAAGSAHPPRPHPGDERRELPAQAQQGNRRLPSSRRSRGKIGRTLNAVSSRSFNVPTPTNLLPSVITSVVHDHAAPVAQSLGAIDTVGSFWHADSSSTTSRYSLHHTTTSVPDKPNGFRCPVPAAVLIQDVAVHIKRHEFPLV